MSILRVGETDDFVNGGHASYVRPEAVAGAAARPIPMDEPAGAWSSLDGSLVGLVESAMRLSVAVEVVNLSLQQSLLASPQLHVVAASSLSSRDLEDLQVDVGEGPSYLAALKSRIVRSADLRRDRRWPTFAAQAAPLAMSSVVSLPLVVAANLVGVLSVYSPESDALGELTDQLAAAFAGPAALAVHTAQALNETRQAAAKERLAAAEHAVVDRAVALMTSRNGGDEARALTRLEQMSRRKGESLAATAEAIVEEAFSGASARYAEESFARHGGHSAVS